MPRNTTRLNTRKEVQVHKMRHSHSQCVGLWRMWDPRSSKQNEMEGQVCTLPTVVRGRPAVRPAAPGSAPPRVQRLMGCSVKLAACVIFLL